MQCDIRCTGPRPIRALPRRIGNRGMVTARIVLLVKSGESEEKPECPAWSGEVLMPAAIAWHGGRRGTVAGIF